MIIHLKPPFQSEHQQLVAEVLSKLMM